MIQAVFLSFVFLHGLALADEKPVSAIDAETGRPVVLNTVISSPKNHGRNFIDGKNLRIELGPASVGMFSDDGNFHLLRGSAILQSVATRTTETANAKINFLGRIVTSYDFRERSSSVFVLNGYASLENSSNPGSNQKLEPRQGASLITGNFYPTVVRNLDFSMVNTWLSRYGWSAEKRNFILEGVPTTQQVRTLASITENTKSEKTEKELLSYFPVMQNETGPQKYEKTFTSSALRGKEDSKLEQDLLSGEKIEFISPEQAAIIVLPEMNLGKPDIKLHTLPEGSEQLKQQGRKPASLQKVKAFKPEKLTPTPIQRASATLPVSTQDPSVQTALDRLNQVEQNDAFNESAAQKERELNDLRQNF